MTARGCLSMAYRTVPEKIDRQRSRKARGGPGGLALAATARCAARSFLVDCSCLVVPALGGLPAGGGPCPGVAGKFSASPPRAGSRTAESNGGNQGRNFHNRLNR